MTPLQRTIVERALILAKELEAAAVSAPNGQVIDRCETLLLADGREFLRRALEATLRDRVEALEQKGPPAGPAPMLRPAWAGWSCCGATSPARAAGWAVPMSTACSASTASYATGQPAGMPDRQPRRLRRGPRRGRAPARRHHGQHHGRAARDQGRHLRPPRAGRVGDVGRAGHPGVAGPDVLDIYDASEHIAEAGRKLLGDGAAEARAFLEGGRALRLSDRWAGLCDHIGVTPSRSAELSGHAAWRPESRAPPGRWFRSGGRLRCPERPEIQTPDRLIKLNLSTLQIAEKLDIHRSDAQAMVQSLRQGVVDRRPAAALEGEVECDEVYVVAGHKGSPGVVEATGGSGVGGA